MQGVLSATKVRNNWGQFNDDVVRRGPQFVKRNRDEWAALSKEHLNAALGSFQFNAEFLTEDDDSVTAVIEYFGIVANGKNEDEALDELTEFLIDYAEKYQSEFKLYYHSPNRRDHFPYIMHVLIQDNKQEVKNLIKCPAGKK